MKHRWSTPLIMLFLPPLMACGSSGSGAADRTPVVGDQGARTLTVVEADLNGDGAAEKITLLSPTNPTIIVLRVGAKGRIAVALRAAAAAAKLRVVEVAPGATALELTQPLMSSGEDAGTEYRFFTYRKGSLIASPKVDVFPGAKPMFAGDGRISFVMTRCAAGSAVQRREVRLRLDESTGFMLLEQQRTGVEERACK